MITFYRNVRTIFKPLWEFKIVKITIIYRIIFRKLLRAIVESKYHNYLIIILLQHNDEITIGYPNFNVANCTAIMSIKVILEINYNNVINLKDSAELWPLAS